MANKINKTDILDFIHAIRSKAEQSIVDKYDALINERVALCARKLSASINTILEAEAVIKAEWEHLEALAEQTFKNIDCSSCSGCDWEVRASMEMLSERQGKRYAGRRQFISYEYLDTVKFNLAVATDDVTRYLVAEKREALDSTRRAYRALEVDIREMRGGVTACLKYLEALGFDTSKIEARSKAVMPEPSPDVNKDALFPCLKDGGVM